MTLRTSRFKARLKLGDTGFFSRSAIIIVMALLGAWLLISYLLVDFVMKRRLSTELQRYSGELELKSEGVAVLFEHSIHHQYGISATVAESPLVKSALHSPVVRSLPETASAQDRRSILTYHPQLMKLNRYLFIANRELGDDQLFVINSAGNCIASNNFDSPNSLVGTNYADRTYFKTALAGERGRQYAVGRLSGIPGFFFSAPVYEKGVVIGVVVTKITSPDLAGRLKQFNCFITDAAGVIVLSSNKNLEYLALNDAPVFRLSSDEAEKQYKRHNFSLLKVNLGSGMLNSYLVSIFPGVDTPFMLSRHPQDKEGYSVYTFAPLDSIKRYRNLTIQSTGLMFISGMTIILLLAGVRRYLNDVKLINAELRKSEEKYRFLFDNASDAIFIIDAEGKIVAVNQQASKSLGYSHYELMTMAVGVVDAPEQRQYIPERFARLMEQGFAAFETVHLHKDGSAVPTDVNASRIVWDGQPAIMSICRDISERKQVEEERRNMELQMQQTQKLESLGILAGGIAHDFNNILMAIMGNADLALLRINPESPAVDNLKRIEQSAARAADLAKQMLAYSGKGKFVIEHIDLSRLVEEMLHMMEVSISKKVVLRLNLNHAIPAVEADATQLRQIIMNLIVNASEAIGDTSGVIAITTSYMECDRNYLKSVWLNENLDAGLYVSLEVSDTGCGMERETLAKLFDPFFTTKFTGRGLGMAAVLGIVRGHKGTIRVYSEPGKGSTFRILLPSTDRTAQIFVEGEQQEWKGKGTVLLIDDEEMVREIGSEMLRELGLQVVTAEDGRDALQVFKSRDDIDFVILDLTMPHVDGEQCFRELRELKPDVKVIISSGFNQQQVTEKFLDRGLAGFIQKPYRFSALKEQIKGILEMESD